jgi:hypothetical protein
VLRIDLREDESLGTTQKNLAEPVTANA